jgi:Major Facilitator Superfamily
MASASTLASGDSYSDPSADTSAFWRVAWRPANSHGGARRRRATPTNVGGTGAGFGFWLVADLLDLPNSRRALIAGEKSVMVHAHRSGPIGSLPVAVILLKTESAGLVVADIPRFYMVHNISYAGFSSSAGKMSDHVGAPTTIFIGYLFLVLSYVVLAFAQSVWTLLLGFLLLGFFPALTDGVQRSLAAQLTNKGLRGGGLGCWGAPRRSGRRVPLADIRSYRRIRSWCNRYLCRTDTIRRK